MADLTDTPKLPTDPVVVEMQKDHAELKAGETAEVSRYIAEKLSAPERGIARVVFDGPLAEYKPPKPTKTPPPAP